jgi:trehalose 6-phosphate phosphatase
MRNLLLERNLSALSAFVDARVLLAFDFDGTLAPIVRQREQAAMRPRTASLLRRLCQVFPVAVISGRGLADVASRLEGLGVRYVVGNHGLEFPTVVWADQRTLDEARSRLRSFAAASPGVEVEDKQYSLAVHFRGQWRLTAAEEAVQEALAGVRLPLRTIPGKRVVSVVPGGALDKGDALLLLRTRDRARRVLYVGDDVTDEDVFRSSSPARLLAVRVGRSVDSAARYFIASQREIDGLLLHLVRLGERGRT